MSAPESVRTTDGITWTLRTVTSSGIALYAPKGVCECPAFVMATLAELAEHGIQSAELAAAVAEYGAFPVPMGPGSLSAARLTEAEARAAHLYEFGGDATADEWNRLAGDDVPLLAGEVRRQAAEIVSLNEALTVAAEQLRADRAHAVGPAGEDECSCPPADRVEPHQVGCALADVPCPVDGPLPGLGSGSPEMRGLRTALAGSVDAVTAAFSPVAASREASSREEPHDSPLHQAHRLGHDLDVPGTGGAL